MLLTFTNQSPKRTKTVVTYAMTRRSSDEILLSQIPPQQLILRKNMR
jgi:hypothetical protein